MSTVGKIQEDIEILSEVLTHIPFEWESKQSITEMKQAGSPHWKQMEWIGFYAEFLIRGALAKRPENSQICPDGDIYGNVSFDLKRAIIWDIKTHPNTAHGAILNDCEAMDLSLKDHGHHGILMICADCQYDTTGEFKAWHDTLKGGTSLYEQERIQRNAPSRRRKVSARLTEARFIVLDPQTIRGLNKKQKGWRNADGKPRRGKYAISNQQIEELTCTKIDFPIASPSTHQKSKAN
jgi:hypothetical protein